jgi:hypothetical protein
VFSPAAIPENGFDASRMQSGRFEAGRQRLARGVRGVHHLLLGVRDRAIPVRRTATHYLRRLLRSFDAQ